MDPVTSGRAVAGMGPGCWERAWVLVGLGCAREGWGLRSRTGLPQASIPSGNRALFRRSPRHPYSRPGGTCGSGQGVAEQASPRCPHLLRGPPHPLCLTLALFSLHGHLSLPGECSRYFCRLSAGTSPPTGRRACGRPCCPGHCQSARVRAVGGMRAKPTPPPDFSSKAPECLRIPCRSLACKML